MPYNEPMSYHVSMDLYLYRAAFYLSEARRGVTVTITGKDGATLTLTGREGASPFIGLRARGPKYAAMRK